MIDFFNGRCEFRLISAWDDLRYLQSRCKEAALARIPLLNSPDNLSARQKEVFDAVVSGPRGRVQGPLMAALHNPELADRWQQLGAVLRYETSLPTRLSELAILVTARAWNCQLEWHIHEAIAREQGLDPDIIDAIRTGRQPENADAEAIEIYEFVNELHRDKFVSKPVYDRVLARWNVPGAVELTALSGYYSMVAMTLNAHEFPIPDGAAPPLAPLSA